MTLNKNYYVLHTVMGVHFLFRNEYFINFNLNISQMDIIL